MVRYGLVLLLVAAPLAADAPIWGQAVGGRTTLMVGVKVAGREVGVVEALATEQGVCLLVEDFARLAAVQWQRESRVLATPLGQTTFAPEELLQVEGAEYLCPPTAHTRLGVEFLFDPQEVALTLDLPWGLALAAPVRALVPEIHPPAWGVGQVRADAWLVRQGETTSYVGSLTLAGRAAAGQWRLLLDRPNQEDAQVREFFWQRQWSRAALALGRSFTQLSPLLSGYDFAGAQLAWSNEDLPARQAFWGGSVPWQGALRTFRGPAPPGSLVQLKVDGVVVASQLVGLSGRYEFLDVPVAGRGALVVEVQIFDRHNLLVPQEVRREVVSGAFQLLPEGRWVQVAGLGWGGFFGRQLLGESHQREPAGFYAGRRALGPRGTAEVLLQAVGDEWQVGVGLAGAPAPWWWVAGEAAASRGGRAFLVESQGVGSSLEFNLRWLSQSQGFAFGGPSLPRHDRSLELRRFFGSALELGLWARDVAQGGQRYRWLRPTLGLSLKRWLFLRVVPDQQGDLWGVLFATPTPRLRYSASVASTQVHDLTYDLGDRRWQLRATWERGGGVASRVTATAGWRAGGWWSPALRVGVSHSGGRTAPYAELSARLGGLWLRAEYQGIPGRLLPGQRLRPRLYLSLTADYSYASGLLAPSGHLPVQLHTGAVAGRLVLLGGKGRQNLAGARVVVVGVGGAVTDASGRFFVGSVPPGVYEVVLDAEKLPLELSVHRGRAVVEVEAGLATRVDFLLEERFGLAGQVVDASGQGLAVVTVVLVDERGQAVASGLTDAFGYYRFDQIPAGRYLVQLRGAQGQVLAQREVVLSEFLFGQDLQLP